MYMSTKDGVTSINWRVRENGKKNNLFTKITQIRNDVKELLPEIEETKFLAMTSHIRNFHYGNLHYGRRDNPKNKERKRELTEAERVLYDYFLKNGLNPSTTY